MGEKCRTRVARDEVTDRVDAGFPERALRMAGIAVQSTLQADGSALHQQLAGARLQVGGLAQSRSRGDDGCMQTDSGKEFSDQFFGSKVRNATALHEFDRLCEALGIEHRLQQSSGADLAALRGPV